MAGNEKARNYWWVTPLLTFFVVVATNAVTFGVMTERVNTIQRKGSDPVNDLQIRVSVLENMAEQNKIDHKDIKDGVNDIKRALNVK